MQYPATCDTAPKRLALIVIAKDVLAREVAEDDPDREKMEALVRQEFARYKDLLRERWGEITEAIADALRKRQWPVWADTLPERLLLCVAAHWWAQQKHNERAGDTSAEAQAHRDKWRVVSHEVLRLRNEIQAQIVASPQWALTVEQLRAAAEVNG